MLRHLTAQIEMPVGAPAWNWRYVVSFGVEPLTKLFFGLDLDSIDYAAITDDSFRFIPMRLQSADLKRIHGIDERIAVSDYAQIVQFYTALVRNGAGENSPGLAGISPGLTR